MQIVGSYCPQIINRKDMYHEKLLKIAKGDLFSNSGNHCMA
jgi:hypothetical protein